MMNCWNWVWALGLDPAILDVFWREIWTYRMHPYPAANAFLANLKARGYKTVIVSSRGSLKVPGREHIAKSNAIDCISELDYIDDVILMDARIDSKATYLNRINAKYFVDDHITHVVDAYLNSCCAKTFLFNRPYNNNCADILGYTRIFSYDNLLDELE
jgi:glycerol-3-phosphate cytidylyltransferase-like family protein